jgi:predicted dehydrogenase
VRVAIAGLATSHPFADAGHLRRLFDAELVVWEPDSVRRERFLDQHPAEVVGTLEALVSAAPDGVVVTVRPDQAAAVASRFLAAGAPVFVNKPAAVTLDQLARLDAVVTPYATRFLTSSVLRFAPDFQQFRREFTAASVLSARVTVRHDIGWWVGDPHAWQDDPETGGGLLATMGLHGVELLVALFGADVAEVSARRARRRHRSLRSEDVAQIDLRWSNGMLATVDVLGVANEESYAVSVLGERGECGLVLRDDGRPSPFGYAETIAAFAAMIEGAPVPVDWAESRAVLRTLALARAGATPISL